MTPAGVASVSLRQPLPAMTEAASTKLIIAGMRQAALDNQLIGPVSQPFPSQRIVWHDNPSGSRSTSLLVVNVFDGADPYAYEETTIPDSAPTAIVTSEIASMSKRILADITARANTPTRLAERSHGTKRT
jgi:hypothetical protein